MLVEVLLYPGFDELDAIGPFEILSHGFEVALVSLDGTEPVTGARGAAIVPHRVLGERPDWLLVPGGGWNDRSPQGAWAEAQAGRVPAAIVARQAAGSRLAGVCTGTMLLAAAGVLKGRRAITHHAAVGELAERGVEVVEARVVDDGDIVTCGGVTSGLDLALWLLEREVGAELSAGVAREIEHERAGDVALAA